MYFKTVPGLVDIRFTSLPKVMKKIKSDLHPHPTPILTPPLKIELFFIKKDVLFWKLYNVLKSAETVLRVTNIQTIFQNKNENQASRLGVEYEIIKNVSPKTMSHDEYL